MLLFNLDLIILFRKQTDDHKFINERMECTEIIAHALGFMINIKLDN